MRPELLAPAGSLKHQRYAYAYGADAVYAGMPRYSLRARNNEFSRIEVIERGIQVARDWNKKLFLTVNAFPHNAKIKTFIDDMRPIMALNPDALIMADPGLIMMIRETWPDAEIHLSVQANTMNYASVKFWQQIGVKRIILSRELSLDQIEEIRQQCPDMELEVFVHGALCIAFSGRCLLSGYFNHRDANQGTCTNSCRWDYKVMDENTMAQKQTQASVEVAVPEPAPVYDPNQTYYIEEGRREGEYMPIEEDEHGTYIMNSKDLRALEHVQRLVKIGIDSFKIEGRTKSHYYVARTAQVYRQAIDDAVAGKELDPALLADLENLSNRGYTDGFFQRHHDQEYQNYLSNYSRSKVQQFVGEVIGFDQASGMAEVEVKNRFSVGDKLELLSPHGNYSFDLDKLEDDKGNTVEVAPGSGYRVRMPVKPGEWEMALLTRYA
jgi:putative protease